METAQKTQQTISRPVAKLALSAAMAQVLLFLILP
jgi:hypothetical protein